MSKSIDNLNLNELIELKTACDLISNSYANELTDYATMHQDPYFRKIDTQTKIKYDKRIKSKNLSLKIENRIEKLISEYYD